MGHFELFFAIFWVPTIPDFFDPPRSVCYVKLHSCTNFQSCVAPVTCISWFLVIFGHFELFWAFFWVWMIPDFLGPFQMYLLYKNTSYTKFQSCYTPVTCISWFLVIFGHYWSFLAILGHFLGSPRSQIFGDPSRCVRHVKIHPYTNFQSFFTPVTIFRIWTYLKPHYYSRFSH